VVPVIVTVVCVRVAVRAARRRVWGGSCGPGAVYNQRILTAWNARQEDDARRAAKGLPPKDRRQDRHPSPVTLRARRIPAAVRQREELRGLLAELEDLTLETIEADSSHEL
jgi:hypothetical protein